MYANCYSNVILGGAEVSQCGLSWLCSGLKNKVFAVEFYVKKGVMELAIDKIQWSKFKMYKIEDSDLDNSPDLEFPFHPGSRFRAINTGIDEPTTQINYEDFYKGMDIVWSMPHDEVQYVVSGRAEIEYHLPPLMQESGKVIAEPGCVFLLPQGARIVWRVLSDEPFRHLCICYPNPGYPIPKAASIAD